MFFCSNPRECSRWWADLIDVPVKNEDGFFWFELEDGTEVGFHAADDIKNPLGASTVAYLSLADLNAAIATVAGAGGSLHRGPLAIEGDRTIAQVKDPFGTVVGLDERRDR